MANNPLFNALGNGMPMENMPNPFGNMTQFMQQFQQFKQNFSGDPKQKVQELLNSGKISQQQLNYAQQLAKQLQELMPK